MVIQRIQTLWLLLAAVMMGCFSFVGVATWQLPEASCRFTMLGITALGDATGGNVTGLMEGTWYLFALSLLSTILPFIAIFCFKNFRLQKSLCRMTILFVLLLLFLTGIVGYTAFANPPAWTAAIAEPFVAFFAAWMALINIKKDQKLLESVNRLR